MPKIISASEAASMVKEGDRIMFGGFIAGCGAPETIIENLVKHNTKNLHLIAICTDYPDIGVGKLVSNKQIKSAQTSHIGTNPATQEQFKSGEMEIEFVPQGTLIERIRAYGAGLGGVLTPVGLKTVVEDNKPIIDIDGENFILEKPIIANIAIIRATQADTSGNLTFTKSAKNDNPIMAMVPCTTIVEVDEIVETGQLNSEEIVTPGLFIDYIVQH